jgi:hypothetical protein
MLMAFADVKYGCLQMLDGLVSTHPTYWKLDHLFLLASYSFGRVSFYGECDIQREIT